MLEISNDVTASAVWFPVFALDLLHSLYLLEGFLSENTTIASKTSLVVPQYFFHVTGIISTAMGLFSSKSSCLCLIPSFKL